MNNQQEWMDDEYKWDVNGIRVDPMGICLEMGFWCCFLVVPEVAMEAMEVSLRRENDLRTVPSGNETWQWTIYHSWFFAKKTSIYPSLGIFQLATFDDTGGFWFFHSWGWQSKTQRGTTGPLTLAESCGECHPSGKMFDFQSCGDVWKIWKPDNPRVKHFPMKIYRKKSLGFHHKPTAIPASSLSPDLAVGSKKLKME